jgi:ABC-type antimicrobial peptide transport system permease subunit
VVGDTRTGDFDEPYQPEFFLPYAQNPSHQRPLVTMKVAGDPLSYENAVRKIVAGIDDDELVFRYQTLTTDIANAAVGQRFEAMLVSSFAGLALLLSALGLYAVLSYVVAERTRELGLRMALGATRLEILRIVLKRGLGLSMIGIGVGALTSVFATRLITDFLFKVRPLDLPVYLIVATVLIFVSIAAAIAPALRAASLDPMRTLRQQ